MEIVRCGGSGALTSQPNGKTVCPWCGQRVAVISRDTVAGWLNRLADHTINKAG